MTSEWHSLSLQSRPRVERGFHFLAGRLPTVTTARRGADTGLRGENQPLKAGSLTKTHN